MELETIDKLFLELSQFTTAQTAKEIALRARLESARELLERWKEFYATAQDTKDGDFKLSFDTETWLAENEEE